MKPDFMSRIAKIVEEVRTIACIDDVDVKILEELLQDELYEYAEELDEYYEEEYYIAISSARSKARTS